MDAPGHKDITYRALNNYFYNNESKSGTMPESELDLELERKPKLKLIITGNLDSDNLRTKKAGISDNYNLDAQHFNKASLPECEKFLKQAEKVVVDDFTKAAKNTDISEEDGDYTKAFYDLGRLTHTIQDFYAHTNYINLAGPNSDIWNESVSKPNVKNPKNFKTGKYTSRSKILDKISIFFDKINIFSKKKYKNGKDYDKIYMQNSNHTHDMLNKDAIGTIADKAYEAKEGVSGFKTACEYAEKHTKKEWDEVQETLEKNLDDKTYKKLIKKIDNFNPSDEKINSSLNDCRMNFNKKMGN